MKRTIYFNEDNHHFYGAHPPEDMSLEGIQCLVDYYAEGTQVAGILFCTNVQRALFDSKVWEHFWDDYDPELGEDQPALNRTHGVKNHLLLRERGLDQHAIWLERCKHHGIEGWLTMRMNDCHGLKETFLHMLDKECKVGAPGWIIHWPTKFWLEHPELHRAPYRMEQSWEETLTECQRRHAITYPQANAPGGPIRNILPIPLRLPKTGSNFGRMEENITLRINTGAKSKSKRAVLCLGFSGISEEIRDNLEVRLNTQIITACEEPKYESISQTTRKYPQHGWKSDFIEVTCFFGLPVESLFDGDNVVEIMPPQVDGQLVWAEILYI